MTAERRRYWVLRALLLATLLIPMAVGLVLGDPVPGGGPGPR